jgi:mono/diheme cytochrome c family protein
VLASGDATAVALLAKFNNLQMPAMRLEPQEMEALLIYLAHPEEAVHHAPAVPVPAKVADAARGKALFVGTAAFANGGAPCLGCHGIAGIGLAGGANYGPDLTTMYENFGEDGVAGILESLPFPSMEPIYATRPLTPDEQTDLGAYFAQVSGAPVINDQLLLGEVAGGVLGLLAVLLFLGWRRLQGVRRPLVERAKAQEGRVA